MKITVTINTGATLATVDIYPQENVLWIKTNGACVQKKLTTDEATLIAQLLSVNPIGKFLEMISEKTSWFEETYTSEAPIHAFYEKNGAFQ